jgi:hypothetical protein
MMFMEPWRADMIMEPWRSDDGSLMSHVDPNDVVEPMMLTHDDDGDTAILEMP